MLYLSFQLFLSTLEVLDEQVLAGELVVVGEVVDALPVIEVHLVQLMVNPPAAKQLMVNPPAAKQLGG